LRFPLIFLFVFPEFMPHCDQNIGRFSFSRYVHCSANAAGTSLEIPAVHFRIHGLATGADAPVGSFIKFYSIKSVNMCICRAQFKVAVDAVLIFPILCVSICRMRNHACDSGAGGTSSPVTGLISVINILVISSAGSTVTAAVANLITIGCIDVVVDLCLLTASGTDFPVLCIIV